MSPLLSHPIAGAAPQAIARTAGALYLAVVVLSIYALNVVSGVTIRGDAAATASNLARDAAQFRLAVAANVVATLCYIGVVGLLNELMRPVDAGLSRLAVLFGLAGCVIGAMVAALQMAAPALIGAAAAVSSENAQAIRVLMISAGRANSVALTLFGCYCLLLGWLVLRSGFIPKVFGALLMLSGISWLGGNLALILMPELAGRQIWIVGLAGLGEILFTLWLVVKGVDVRRWKECANTYPTTGPSA